MLKKKAIVLGGTRPHIELINKLKNLNFYVILIDFLDSPIAKPYADKHIKESTLNKSAVLKIAKENSVDLVISSCIDQANVTACYVTEKLNLPQPYSYETALNVTDKLRMKRIMMENGIPTSLYAKIKNAQDLSHINLRYPLIIKPVDSNSSKGVIKVENKYITDIEDIIQKATSISRSNEAIIEEYIEGTEIGIDCFVKDGRAYVLMIKERRKINKHNNGVQQIYGCIWPHIINDVLKEKIENIATKIANVFNLRNCPLMIQAIINNDNINIIEFGARIGGGESYKIIKDSTGFDYVGASIDSFLGNEIKMEYHAPIDFYADNFIYTYPGIFKKIVLNKEYITDDILYYCKTSKTPGSNIGGDISSNNRVGCFVVKSNTLEELYTKIDVIISNMEVYDINDMPMMRKDIY